MQAQEVQEAKQTDEWERLARNKLMAEATKLNTKLTPLVGGFERIFGDALAFQLPPAQAQGGQKLCRELKEFEQEAKEVLQ